MSEYQKKGNSFLQERATCPYCQHTQNVSCFSGDYAEDGNTMVHECDACQEVFSYDNPYDDM